MEETTAFTWSYFVSQIKSIGILDVMDILVVTLLLYLVYTFIRDRRAEKLILGVGLLLLIMIISNLLGLSAMSFIMTNLFQVGFVALAVVFQPELRSVLEKVGGEPIRSLKSIGSAAKEQAGAVSTGINEIARTAEELSERHFESLAVALIEYGGEPLPVTAGLPDEAFSRAESVPMTKSEIRAVCLSKLALREDSVVWDVGAGTGSVTVEAAMAARRGRVYAVERKDAAFDILRENLRKFHTDNVTPVSGTAPDACADLPAPTHAFLGGTTGHMKEIIALLLEKNPRVRIVATAVTLESVAELTECVKAFPFRETEAVSLTAARSRKAGAYHLMTGQNPVYIFTMQG